MKKLLFLLLAIPCFVFGQTSDATLTTQAQQIKNETVAGANTANRVGTHLQNLVYSKKSFFTDGTASGTNTYSVTLDNGAITSLTSQWFVVKFTNANSGASTLNINAIGAKSLVKTDGTALSSGDIDAGSVHLLSYDGTNLQVLSLGGGGSTPTPGGSDTQIQYNDGGAFGGEAVFIYNETTNLLTVPNVSAGSSSSLTNASTVTITGTKHTLTSTQATITWTLSQTGDFQTTDIILNATSATWTFPANTLCIVEGIASGTNTAALAGVSGDHYILSIYKDGTNYKAVIKNFGQ